MARRGPIRVGLALAVLCAVNLAQAEESCRTGCRGASQTFKYQDGTTYKYNFDSKIEISLASAEGQKSLTEVKATVLVSQQPQCNQVIRLQNVQVISSDGRKHANIPDVDKPIRINYHDGHLEDSICATPGDSQNSLNLKRAVASILQANLIGGHETDVFGLCQTEVAQHKEGNVLVIQKSRNLNRCAYRESLGQEFLGTAFNLNSEIKSSPLLNADYSAKLRVKNGVLDQATVTENYLYVPFSVGNKGAKATVETTLKFSGTSRDNPQTKCSQPRSIIFENPHPVNSPASNINSILGAVRQTAKTIGITVNDNTAKEFANLIRIFRVSKKDDLLAVYNQVKSGAGFADKAIAKRLFLDALLTAGNGDNIEAAVELLRNKELDIIDQNRVYLGLSLARHPTEGSLNSAVSLLNLPNLPRNAYLGIGNLAGRYLRQHPRNKVDAVNKLSQKLVQKLGNGKATTRQQEGELVYILKALANIGRLNDNIVPKITAIAQDKKAANRLRVTALEVYLADACKDKLRDSALTILKDIQQDSEVRIRAYLVLAQCPNSKVGNAVKALLENEPSYQVGGFIVSHIRNIRASANPDKALAKQHLGFINLPKRFPVDLRKYSVNGEFSYTVDSLGLANSVESNVIYSQNSFLPRATTLNLTTEIFGHNLNFLEIETRQENLDRLLEHYLGPKGLLRANSLQDLLKNKGEHAKNLIQELHQKIDKSLRSRRDVTKAEIDQIAKQVQIKTNDLNKDLDLDVSVKAFGAEVFFVNVNDDVRKFTPEALIDRIVSGLNTGLDKIKNFEETLKANLLFLEADLAYPTSSGFPLRLSVEGSSNLQVKAAGAIDVRAILKRDSTIKVSLIPSANIEVTGRLTIDALVVESGLKVSSTLYTATGGDLIVQLSPNGYDVKYALPLKEQTLVSANHRIVFETRESGGPETIVPLKFAQNKDFSICFDQLNPFIGLILCGEYNGPNAQGKSVPVQPFPLSGDAKFSVTISSEDLKEYQLKQLVYPGQDKLGAEMVIAAVGENGQRKASLAVEAFLIPEKLLRIALTSPVTSATAEGRIISTNSEKSLSLRFIHDNNEYLAKIGVGIEGSEAKAVYKPLIQYKTPENSALQVPPYRVEGQIIVERKSISNVIYTLDNVRVVIPDQKTISVNGKLGYEPETVFADLTVSDGSSRASFNGKLRVNPNLIKYNAELKNSLNAVANIRLKGELSRSQEEVKNFLQLAHGGDFSDKNNILTLENLYKYRNKGPEDFLLETKNELKYPVVGADLDIQFQLKPRSVQYEVDIQYSNVKLGSKLEFEKGVKKEGTEYELEFSLWGLNNKLSLEAKRKVQGEQSQIENRLEYNGRRFEINGKVRHHVKPRDIDVGADLIVKVPDHNQPFQIVNGLKLNANEIDVSHKVTSGSTVYIDLFLKANRVGNANGSIKVNLQGQLTVTGQVKANKGSGNGDILIELPSAKRSAKLDTTFTIRDPNFNILVNIYPVFNENKSKKITVSTHTTATPNSVDSKNLVDFFGEKLEVNVKGSNQGDLENGKQNGEIDVILPNQHYFAAKLNRDVKTVNNVINGNGLFTAEHRKNKNQPGSKFTAKALVKNTNLKERIYNVEYKYSIERTNGQNLNIDLALKRDKQSDGSNLDLSTKLYGSILDGPIEASVQNVYKGSSGSVNLKSSYAPLGSLALVSQYDTPKEGKPCTGKVDLQVTSSSKILKNFKVALAGSALTGPSIDIKGEGSIYADSADGNIVNAQGVGEIIASAKDGRIKVSVNSDKIDRITVDAGYKQIDGKDGQQLQGDLGVQYGKNQNIKGDVTLLRLPKHEYRLDLKLDAPVEKFRSTRLQVHSKRNEERTHYESEVIFTTDGRTWTTNSDIVLSEISPSIDFRVKDPEGKQGQLYVKINKISDRELSAQLKLLNERKNFLLEGSIDSNIESIDNFHIKVTANSPALKLDKIVAEAQNKPTKAGRRIQVTAKSGNKNLLTGSTSYTSREEHGKLIVEGSGSFKVKDTTKSANFKFIKQNLSQEKNGETGLEVSFDASLGNEAIDAEFKITNKQFRILESYCEEKKQCAHVEIDVKTLADDVAQFNQEIEIAIDLRKLGLSHEFGLKAVTNRKEYTLDHTVDVHFQSTDNSKYQYSLYLHPKQAGVSLTTPKRTIALEANVNVPHNVLKDGGRISGEVALFPDKKNQPNQKSAITAFLNLDTKEHSLNGEAKFTNPALRRPLAVSLSGKFIPGTRVAAEGVIIVDVFAQPDQKLIISYRETFPGKSLRLIEDNWSVDIKSSGLNIDITYVESLVSNYDQKIFKYSSNLNYHVRNSQYKSAILTEISPSNLEVSVTTYNIQLIKLSAKSKVADKQQVVDGELALYGRSPLVSHLEIKNYNSLLFTLARKSNPNKKLQISAAVILEQIAEFRAELGNQALGHATLKLDDANFLKPEYNVNSKNIEELVVKPIRAAIQDEGRQLQELSDKSYNIIKQEVKQLDEIAKRSAPNLAPLRQYYISEINKIREEILADKTIKDLSELLHNIFGAIADASSNTFNSFSALIENTARTLNNSFGKLIESIEKDLLPKLKQISEKILTAAVATIDRLTEIVLLAGTKAAQIAETYKPEIQQLLAIYGKVTENLSKAVVQAYEAIRSVVLDQYQQIYNEIKQLPALEQLKVTYEQIVQEGLPAAGDLIKGSLSDILTTLKDLAPFEEVKVLIEAIEEYVLAKLNGRQIDDNAAIDKITKAAIATVRKISSSLQAGEGPNVQNVKLPLPVNILSKLPRIAAVRFSPLSYLLKEESSAALEEFLLSLVNRPRNWVPPFPLFALIAQGQHIFTFDGKHLTFPGKCNYLLARDAVDGNFTVAGTYANGLLTAISLNHGPDTISLRSSGQVFLNNAPTELPIRRAEVGAFFARGTITLISKYGIRVTCDRQLILCGVQASGFYHGKLRGLLGNGNNEPYDDFTIPNGKIVTAEGEFGNSYKLGSGCSAVQVVSHKGHHSAASCDKLFGQESSLRYCYPFVNNNNFRQACEHGVAAGVKNTEAAIAAAYVTACNRHAIPVRLPSEFVKCTNGPNQVEVGETFSVKTPQKAADIVLLVNTNKANEIVYKEYIQPLVQQLTNELSSKGISDVEFHLIAYGGENRWPSHITTGGGKLTFKGKAPNLKFAEDPKDEEVSVGCTQVDGFLRVLRNLGHDLKLALGRDLQAQTYGEGLNYPFRAHAIKSIIAVTEKPCEVGKLYPLQLLRALLIKDDRFILNLITPINREGAKADAKNIVGFSSEDVVALGATKGKVKSFSDLNKVLEYKDYCIDYTIHNDGYVFLADNFVLQPKTTRKQFVQLTSHAIVNEFVGTERGYDCECKYVNPYNAHNICKQVSSKEKPQQKKGGRNTRKV